MSGLVIRKARNARLEVDLDDGSRYVIQLHQPDVDIQIVTSIDGPTEFQSSGWIQYLPQRQDGFVTLSGQVRSTERWPGLGEPR